MKLGDTKRIWWKCKSKKCGHNWKDTIYGRIRLHRNCPKCKERNKKRRSADKFGIHELLNEIKKTSKEIKKLIDNSLNEELLMSKRIKSAGTAKAKLGRIKKLCMLLRYAITDQKNLDEKEYRDKKNPYNQKQREIMLKAKVHPEGFFLNKELSSFVNEKIIKLFRHYNKIENIKVNLKKEKDKPKRNRFVEIIIFVPGKRMVSGRTADKFEYAFMLAEDSIKKQIVRYKKKIKKEK